MAGKFGSGDFCSFLHAAKESERRFAINFDAIIKKYEKPEPNDDVIDLQSLHVLTNGGLLSNRKTYPFGLSKFATSQRRERNKTADSTNLDGKTSQTICDSFVSDGLNASVVEENCTKIFSFICVDDNDPSDAETLSTCSTSSDESWEECNSQSQFSDCSPRDKQTPVERSTGRQEDETLSGSDDIDGDFLSKSWYTLKKSTSISSDNSGVSKPVLRKSSAMCLPSNPTPDFKRKKVLIPKKIQLKNVATIDHSAGLNKSEDIACDKCCVSRVTNSVGYESSSEDSTFEPCHNPPWFSYKSDIVRAWVDEQQDNRANIKVCDNGVFSHNSKQDVPVGEDRIKLEVQDDADYAAALTTHTNHNSESSVESNATYIIPAEKETKQCTHDHGLCDCYQAGETMCAEMSYEHVFSPEKQNTSFADLTTSVKKSILHSTSRRILRARKRFKPPLLSMTEQQLQEFFDSPHPDFTMFYTSAQDVSKDTESDCGTMSDLELKYRKNEQRFTGNGCSVINSISNGQIIKQETRSVPNNCANSHPGMKTSLQPTKLQFSNFCAKTMLGHTSNKGINYVDADPAPMQKNAMNIHKNGTEHDVILNEITDKTFIVPPLVGTLFEKLKNMEQEKTLNSVNHKKQSATSHCKTNIAKLLFQPSRPSDAEKAEHSDHKSLSTSNSSTFELDQDLSTDSSDSEQNLFSIKVREKVSKRSERSAMRTCQKTLEMSPVSRLSSLRLSSPVSSPKMVVVSSAKKTKPNGKHCHLVENAGGVALFTRGFQKAAITSAMFSTCHQGETSSATSPVALRTKTKHCELSKPHRYVDRSTKTNSSNDEHHQVAVSLTKSSKCFDTESLFSTECTPLNMPKGSDKLSICLNVEKTQRKERWHQLSIISKEKSNLLNLPYSLQHPGVYDSNMKRRSMQKNIHLKRLQKQTSTPVKRHPMKISPFCLNETLSTIADCNVDMIEQMEYDDEIITLSP